MSIQVQSIMSLALISSGQVSTREDASGPRADITAKKIWAHLRQFMFQDNDIIAFPDQVEQSGTLDCDDFAFYAYSKFKEANIPAKVVLMLNPGEDNETPVHAICMFKAGGAWRMMDYDGIRADRVHDWRSLPTKFYGKAVRYIVVDVEHSWGCGEPFYPMRNPDNWQVSK